MQMYITPWMALLYHVFSNSMKDLISNLESASEDGVNWSKSNNMTMRGEFIEIV